MIQVGIDGLAAIGEALQQFPYVLAKKYLRHATYKAAEVIEQDAITRAPVRTGNMRANIGIFRRSDAEDTAHYAIAVRKIRITRKMKRIFRIFRKAGKKIGIEGDAYYWRFVELGTAKMPAKPFLRPAFESQKENAVTVFYFDLAEGVKAAAAEVAK